eukprot:SAG31_NODE_3973_length_3702_cov_3.586848_2_plen_259_part_00
MSMGSRPVSAYGTWVSEIMLQQTRVETVIPYYIKWMERWPTAAALAAATAEEVNAAWAGLGYYRRARLLHQGAQLVANPPYNGLLPRTVDELSHIPGIGPYTAGAIASIAYGVSAPLVDGNVLRVLSRLKAVAATPAATVFKTRLAWELAEQLIVQTCRPGDLNQALMELGAIHCVPGRLDVPPALLPFFEVAKLAHELSRPAAAKSMGKLRKSASAESSRSRKRQDRVGFGCDACAAGMAEMIESMRNVSQNAAAGT